MSTSYREDPDLAFLEFCDEEDIRELGAVLIYNKSGKKRIASRILSDARFSSGPGSEEQWRKNWQVVAGELQHFGGDTLVNFVRRRGVMYKELLIDVCKKLGIKIDKTARTYQLEDQLLECMFEKSWSKLSVEERDQIISELENIYGINVGITDLRYAAFSIGSSKALSLAISKLLAGTIIRATLPATYIVAGGGTMLAGRALGLLNPAIAVASAVPLLTGPAHRVMLPAVVKTAYMRRKYEEKERF